MLRKGRVTCFSSSFGTTQHLAKRDLAVSEPKATLSFEEVSSTVSTKLEIPVYSEFEHTLEYVAQSDGKIVYAYKFQLRNDLVTKWIEVWCDTTTGEIIQAVNFANKASYRVIERPRRNPTEGFSMVYRRSVEKPTRRKWTDGDATNGNNIITLTPSGRTTRPIRDDVFDTEFNSKEDPGTDANLAAAAVNLFYITNMMHDISARYGFTESAGNFQKDNFDEGGKGGDAVVINVLNPSKTNGADFMTPPDGHPAVMNMYRYTTATPNRSGGLDNTVIVHEYTHGISHRLTGGASSSWCLSTAEARGMGEGWSDVMALIFLAKSSDTAATRIPIGASQSHYVGEVWASMLWEVYWNLVSKHGFATNLYKADQSEGNIVTMKIIIGAMMLQPCNPTFLSARDAIVAADALHYQGANKCEILKGFAKRGLGFKATSSYSNDFSLPPECQ
ncbi:hypothetical protein BASA61_006666 [Batrachochytrium salamandrivorans]|nr:hypothetical protein BASA61_006666 [Batrachochytrium salamandrivorans]